MSMKSLVVVVIFSHNETLEDSEKISLQQCARILGKHPLRLMCPRGMDTGEYIKIAPQLVIDEVDPACLSSLPAYNRFKTDLYLYDYYRSYEYMLTYELDSFVFSDDLLYWCSKDWDFIGAPWFEGDYAPTPNASVISGVNSGFSLRKISSCRRALKSWRLMRPLREVFNVWQSHGCYTLGAFKLLVQQAFFWNAFHHKHNHFVGAEDQFWTCLVPDKLKWFKVADYQSSAKFSFELLASRLYAESNHQLPFGCHKWISYEPDFWRKHIESVGYTFPEK
jgi:hypothetical protein